MIVGNKSDIATPPASSPKKELPFLSCSAKSGSNIGKIFEGLTKIILEKVKTGRIDPEKVRMS